MKWAPTSFDTPMENRPDQPILIEMKAFTERIMVHINHWGTSFRQTKSTPPPVLDGSAECGFGLYLIENCVDRVSYACYPDGKNTISLVKYMSGIGSEHWGETATQKGAKNMNFEIVTKGRRCRRIASRRNL
jgi:hypothetical protein